MRQHQRSGPGPRARLLGEHSIGERLSDLRVLPGGLALATDEAAHELILLDVRRARPVVRQRLKVSSYPVNVVASARGRWACVASVWSRRLTFVALPPNESTLARVTAVVDLPFAPRGQVLVRDDTRLIVADSFGDRLGIVDPAKPRLLHVRRLPSHNIRGLGVTPDGRMLAVAHQMLNELAHTTNNDIHWGLLMSNDLRWLRLDSVLRPAADLYAGAHIHPLGHASSATGDPSGLTFTADGTVVVSLGGVGEVAIGREDQFGLQRLKVGRRPTASAATRDGHRVFVANTFSDSISVIDMVNRQVTTEIALGPQPKLTLVDQGELLFYDASLSRDSWMSCNSCHPDGHTNGQMNDNLGDGTFGTPKRVFSLLGQTTDTVPFGWDGSVATLEEEIRNSITTTMRDKETPSDEQIAALAAYLQSLPLPPPIDQARDRRDKTAVARGRTLFAQLKCDRCHPAPTYTAPDTFDVNLKDEVGKNQFNPPSLRGVGQGGPYFHDNRAPTLKAVFDEFVHELDGELSDKGLQDLIAFLESL